MLKKMRGIYHKVTTVALWGTLAFWALFLIGNYLLPEDNNILEGFVRMISKSWGI